MKKKYNMFLEYKNKTFTIPFNPEELDTERQIESNTTTVVGLGEVNELGSPKLTSLDLESVLIEQDKQEEFYQFILEVQKDKKPLRVVCKDYNNFNMLMSVQSFNWVANAERGSTILYKLELLEWRDYSPKIVAEEKPKQTQQQTQQEEKKEEIKEVAQETTEKQINDIVKFNGGNHYRTSQATTPTGKPRTAGNAKITLINKGSRHPFHLIGTNGGSNVYGWVDEGSFN